MENNQDQKEIRLSIFGALGHGFKQMKGNFLVFLLAVIVTSVMQVPLDNERLLTFSPFVSFLVSIYGFLVYSVISFGADLVFLHGVRDGEVKINVMFSRFLEGFERYINVVLAFLFVWALILIGFLLLVVPGIYIACRLSFVSYLVLDEELDPVEAVQTSWRMTRGHVLRIFGFGLMSILIFFGGLILLLVGVFPAVMWVKAGFAALYLAISRQHIEAELEESV